MAVVSGGNISPERFREVTGRAAVRRFPARLWRRAWPSSSSRPAAAGRPPRPPRADAPRPYCRRHLPVGGFSDRERGPPGHSSVLHRRRAPRRPRHRRLHPHRQQRHRRGPAHRPRPRRRKDGPGHPPVDPGPPGDPARRAVDPVVFGAVAVPYLVGAGQSAENHLGRVTGVVSTGPVRQTVALIRELVPKARRIGSLWTSSEINSEYYLDQAREAAAELGFELVAFPVTGPHEIPATLQRLLNERIDVLYPMSDNTLNSSFDVIGRAADENGVPLVASFLRAVEFGACAALGYDFYELGLKTGRLAIRVMDGESPARIPIQSMDSVELYIDPAAAARQGVVFPKAVIDRAKRVFDPVTGPGDLGRRRSRLRSKTRRPPSAGTAVADGRAGHLDGQPAGLLRAAGPRPGKATRTEDR
ncbi:MAG: ABC transporter substrate-binding protein [Candidatus Moduliflexus flocculans]|nr:ABC transporter substrate-binding protein [Candidatus Moduliflexus flocculans]